MGKRRGASGGGKILGRQAVLLKKIKSLEDWGVGIGRREEREGDRITGRV